ncbi:MAG: flagellar biosynthetic protein FliO [Phycisphaerae bacterium]|jgi:flagellar biogenesis protein FliO
MDKKRLKTVLIALAVLAGIIFLGSLSRKNNDTVASVGNSANVQNAGQNAGLQTYTYSSTGIYFRLLFAVFVVAVMGFGVYWMSRRFACKVRGGKAGRIEIIETAYLAARKTLHIVKVGNRTFLIGSTNDSIRSLAELGDELPEEIL